MASAAEASLNPFSIRAMSQRAYPRLSPDGQEVLIPFQSGLCLRALAFYQPARRQVLIPFQSGLCLRGRRYA